MTRPQNGSAYQEEIMKNKLFALLMTGACCGSVYAGPGEDIASKITIRYDYAVDNCGGEDSPAYECSGVVLHGESNFSADMPWSPPDDNSMSYSYLRKDVFNDIFEDYDYGIILTPQNEITDENFRPIYTCAFPVNGATDGRENDGCGKLANWEESVPCQSQGMYTTEDWVAAYELEPDVIYCGWDLKSNRTAEAFKAMIGSSLYYIEDRGFTQNNEVVITSWGDEALINLPVEAIFYAERLRKSRLHNARNLLKAQEAQLNYYSVTGVWIPVIHMVESMPALNKYQYSFSYLEGEQFVPPGGLSEKIRPAL